MSRAPDNDMLAAKAREKAQAAKPGSRERNAWDAVCRALDATGSIEAAKDMLRWLTIPTLRVDAIRMLDRLVSNCAENSGGEAEPGE